MEEAGRSSSMKKVTEVSGGQTMQGLIDDQVCILDVDRDEVIS